MCIRCGPVEQVSYHDSGAPCRRRHSCSEIYTLRFSLVFVVALPRFPSLFHVARDRRVLYLLHCSCSLRPHGFWSRRISVRGPCVL